MTQWPCPHPCPCRKSQGAHNQALLPKVCCGCSLAMCQHVCDYKVCAPAQRAALVTSPWDSHPLGLGWWARPSSVLAEASLGGTWAGRLMFPGLSMGMGRWGQRLERPGQRGAPATWQGDPCQRPLPGAQSPRPSLLVCVTHSRLSVGTFKQDSLAQWSPQSVAIRQSVHPYYIPEETCNWPART